MEKASVAARWSHDPLDHHMQESKSAYERITLAKIPWGGSHKVQKMGQQWPHKMDLGRTKLKLNG